MKATATTCDAAPVSQQAPPDTTLAPIESIGLPPEQIAGAERTAELEQNTVHEPKAEFDILAAIKTLGMEFWNFFLLKIFFSYMLVQVLKPLSVIVTNDLTGVEYWTVIVTILAAPLCYAFSIAKSEKPFLVSRVSIQAVLFAFGFLLTALVGFRGWPEGVLLAIAACGLLVGGAFLGSSLRRGICKKSQPQNTDAPSEASILGFLKESVSGVLGIALGLGLCIGSRYAATSLEAQVQVIRCVGKPAPALNFVSADNEAWSLEGQQGKVVVIEYWSPHCMPCVAAIGTLERIQNEFGQREDFELVSVSLGREKNSVEMFETIDNPWTLVFPVEAKELGFEPAHIPMAYIIDRDGTVYAAGISATRLEEELPQLFAAGE